MYGENNLESRIKQNFKNVVLIIFTLGVWSWIIVAFVWVLGALGWFLLSYIWEKNLFIPQAARSTAFAFLLILVWAFIIFIIMLAWSKYHYQRFYKKNRRKLKIPVGNSQTLAWKELSIGTQGLENSVIDTQASLEINKTFFRDFISLEEKDCLTTFTPIIMKENFFDSKGNIIVSEGEEITPEIIKRVVEEGLYWEFIHKISKYIPIEEENKCE
ncbi:MAG: hypothetical protein K6343_00860 [Caldisericaceae bacterium]